MENHEKMHDFLQIMSSQIGEKIIVAMLYVNQSDFFSSKELLVEKQKHSLTLT